MINLQFGRPATRGNDRISFTLQFPIWPGKNVHFAEVAGIPIYTCTNVEVLGRRASLERRELYSVLKFADLTSIEEAEKLWSRLAVGFVRFAASTGAAIQFPLELTPIERNNGRPNFREDLDPSLYPGDWAVRNNGTRTDGGIFPNWACVLPEHERIWEYADNLREIRRHVSIEQLNAFLASSAQIDSRVSLNSLVRIAAQPLWTGLTALDRRLQYILLVTTLDSLSADENPDNWALGILNLVGTFKRDTEAARTSLDSTQTGALERLSKLLDRIGSPSMPDRIGCLLARAYRFQTDTDQARGLQREVKAATDKRAALVHGGRFGSVPTADEIERLRQLVAEAIDRKIADSNGSPIGT